MSITTQVNVEPTHILITCAGSYDQTEAEQIFCMAFETAARQKVQRLLFDCRKVTGELSTMDRFDLAEYVSMLVLERTDAESVRIAIVGDEPLVDPSRFGETVAVNRGVTGKVTTDLNEAMEWLGIHSAHKAMERDEE